MATDGSRPSDDARPCRSITHVVCLMPYRGRQGQRPSHHFLVRGELLAHGQVLEPERKSTMAGSAASGTVIAQLVEAMRALAGSHPGFRPAHAKGIVCSGTFRGAPEARRVSRAPHLQG
jgi:hypothetical protein